MSNARLITLLKRNCENALQHLKTTSFIHTGERLERILLAAFAVPEEMRKIEEKIIPYAL